MKKTLLAGLALGLCVLSSAASFPCRLSSYKIVYDTCLEAEEGVEAAGLLRDSIAAACKVELEVLADTTAAKAAKAFPCIRLVNTPATGTFEYSVAKSGKDIVIDGGGCWAMNYAGGILAAQMKSNRFKPVSGTVEGKMIFPLCKGADLRIMDDNIWDFSHDTIPDPWKKQQADCRDSVRVPDFLALFRAYMPQVLALQEYNRHFDALFAPQMTASGYQNIVPADAEGHFNNTPIFYRPAELELLDSEFALYTPSKWCNKGSKSYTWAVFKRLSDGKVFAVISTHLWWKSDRVMPGSTMARASQVRLLMAEAERIFQRYSCPIFLMGDMNCQEHTVPMQQLIQAGYQPCYKIATVFGDTVNGHHICGPKDGYSRISRDKPTRETGAIDHLFLWNGGETEVKVFDCITPAFTVPLTDHYPNLLDIKL